MLLAQNKGTDKRDKILQLYDIINTISQSNDMKELLEVTLYKTLKALSSERGSVFLAGDDGQELFLRWSYNMNSSTGLGEVKKRLGEGVIGKVAMDKIPVLVKDIRNDARFKVSSMYRDYKTNSFLCVPIATDVRLIGVINVTEHKCKKPYSEKDLKFLKIVADYIALKIQKSYLVSEMESLKKKVEIEEKFADLGKFASGISHELNNPLDGVIRYVNLALDCLGEGAVREYLIETKTGLSRIANIIRSLLELVRRKRGNVKYVDVNKTIENCILNIRYKAMYKNIDIRKNLSNELPSIADLGLESVFSNLLSNAVDALEEKGAIDVETCFRDGFFEIVISDTGCGIHSADIGRIFEPFFTTKEMTKGCGLGLSICYDIVKRYNGRIDVSSSSGKGTKFTIYLPYNSDNGKI